MLSKTQVDRLGERLRKGTPTDGDEDLLADLMDSYGEALEEVRAVLVGLHVSGLGFPPPTTRVKTLGTLVEKLVRERSRLSTIQDLAGARIVLPSTSDSLLSRLRSSLADQDALVEVIADKFPDSRVSDRRVSPSQGYRAVHVVVRSSAGLPVEVQVRTAMQHRWAEQFERFADRFGRELRYSGVVDSRHSVEAQQSALAVVEAMLRLSEDTAWVEVGEFAWVQLAVDSMHKTGKGADEVKAGLAGFRAVEETSYVRLNAVRRMMEEIS